MIAAMTTLGAAAAAYEIRLAKTPNLFALMLLALSAVIVIGWLIRRSHRREFIETFGVQVCRRCGANGPPHAMFCGKCGGRVKG